MVVAVGVGVRQATVPWAGGEPKQAMVLAVRAGVSERTGGLGTPRVEEAIQGFLFLAVPKRQLGA